MLDLRQAAAAAGGGVSALLRDVRRRLRLHTICAVQAAAFLRCCATLAKAMR